MALDEPAVRAAGEAEAQAHVAGVGPLLVYLGLFVAAWFALYQQYLIRDREPAECFKAFLNNNGFGLVVFCGLLVDYLPSGTS